MILSNERTLKLFYTLSFGEGRVRPKIYIFTAGKYTA